MKEKALGAKIAKSILGYAFLIGIISWVIYEPRIVLSVRDAINIVIAVLFLHLTVENRIMKITLKGNYNSQKQVLDTICKYCPDIIVYKDYNLNFLMCNEPFKKLLKIDLKEDCTGKTIFDIAPKEIAGIVNLNDRKAIAALKPVKYTLKLSDKNKIIEIVCTPILMQGAPVGVITIGRDITEEEKLRERLSTKKEYQKSILDNLPFVAYLKDIEGKIIAGNSKLSEYCNLPLSEVKGLDPIKILLKSDMEENYEEDKNIIKEKKSVIFEKKLNIVNKGEGWYRIAKAPIFNDKKEVVGITVFLSNIDNERKIETQKETFVATLTHDLKTPTIAQIRALELLLNNYFGEMTKEQKEMTEQVLKSCKYMLGMISQVLNTYKFENGQAKIRRQEFDFKEIVDETCNELLNLANEKNLKFNIKYKGKNTVVSGDRIQLKRVVINMVSNAVSYAFENTEIDIVLKEEDAAIAFYTVNSSLYIPSDVISCIFDKYVRSPLNAKFNKVGTGLGLYLSEKIIAAHNGSIIVKSTEDNRNTFGFKIPKSLKNNTKINDTVITMA